MKIAIIGRSEILYETAIMLSKNHEITCIVTSKESAEYTKSSKDYKELAEKFNIPFFNTPRIIEHYKDLKDLGSEIGISINYSGIIPKKITNIFSLGILNAHGGDLPKYRGNACQAWAIINGEKHIGLCVHKMVEKLDSGDIIARDYLPIDHTTKVTSCWEWMADRVPLLFLEAVGKLQKDAEYVLEQQSAAPQDALRCYSRRPEDGRIDWSKSSLEILRLINATNKPYPGAFCEYEGEKMIIWDAELVEYQENFCAISGQVTRIGKGFIEIGCGEGKLMVKEVEFKKKLGTPDNWIRSIRNRLT